jgi:hypothetical protein
MDEEIPRCCVLQHDAIPVSIRERDLFTLIALSQEWCDDDDPCTVLKLQGDLSARSDMAQDLGVTPVCEWDATITQTITVERPDTLSV